MWPLTPTECPNAGAQRGVLMNRVSVDDVRVPGRVYFLHLARPKFLPPNPVGVGIVPSVDVDGAVPKPTSRLFTWPSPS